MPNTELEYIARFLELGYIEKVKNVSWRYTMFKWLNEERFKRLTMFSIYTLLLCQAFPLIYFNYTLDNPVTRNFWTAGLLFPAFVSVIGIVKPELVAKSLPAQDEPPHKKERRGRLIACLTLLIFTCAILYLRLF